MAFNVVRAGQPIRRVVTASWINNINKKRRPGLLTKERIAQNPIKVHCIGDTGVDLNRFDAADLVGPALDYEDWGGSATQYSSLMCKVSGTLTSSKWGVLQGPCGEKLSTRITLAGLTWANFGYTPGDSYVDVSGGALVSGSMGRAVIISPPAAAGKPGLILLGGSGGSSIASGVKLVKTPAGSPVQARSGDTVYGALCTEYKMSGTTLVTNTVTLTAHNPWPIDIPADYYITVVKEQITEKWIMQFPGLLNVRWVDPVLEQTVNGTTYSNIDTAEECV